MVVVWYKIYYFDMMWRVLVLLLVSLTSFQAAWFHRNGEWINIDEMAEDTTEGKK